MVSSACIYFDKWSWAMESGDSFGTMRRFMSSLSIILQSVQNPWVRSFLQGHLATIPLPTLFILFLFLVTVLIVPLPTLGQLMLCSSLPLFDSPSFRFSALLLPLPDLSFAAFSYPRSFVLLSSPIGAQALEGEGPGFKSQPSWILVVSLYIWPLFNMPKHLQQAIHEYSPQTSGEKKIKWICGKYIDGYWWTIFSM